MVALRLAFVILSRRNVSAVSGGSSAEMLNGLTSRAGEMLGAMIAAMAHTESAAGMLSSRNKTGGDAPSSVGFVAAMIRS